MFIITEVRDIKELLDNLAYLLVNMGYIIALRIEGISDIKLITHSTLD